MAKLARIHDGVVVEFLAPLEGFALEDCFPADLLGECVEAADTVEIGWLFDGSSFSAPSLTPPPGKADLIAYAARRRREIEIGGMPFAGMMVATDGESQTKVLGARVAAGADPEFTTPWFGLDGVPVTLDAAAITALSNAMLAHVQGGFVIRGQVFEQIEAGAITTVAQIDEAFAAA